MDRFSYVHQWRGEFWDKGWWHSFELPDGSRIEGVSDLDAQKRRIAQFPIPQDLRGKRVLDIGAWDGWFSFEMERRGAEVLAIDRWENPRFYDIRRMLGSKVDYREIDVYELDPRRIGTFDIVLFMGVFYHLKHPLLGLERACSVSRDMVIVESFVLHDETPRKLLEFFEHDELGGQFDNWFGPTVNCLEAMCRTTGFARVELNNVHDYGAALTCYRKWDKITPADCKLVAAVHADNLGINFRTGRDEYVACYAEGEAAPQPIVGEYGVQPSFSGRTKSGHWQVNFRLPPGLAPGWHAVRLGDSNALEIALDLPPECGDLRVESACDGVTWQKGCMSAASGFLSVWVTGLAKNADVHNVKGYVDGDRQQVTYLGPDGQVNLRVTGARPGRHEVAVACGEARSEAVEVEFVA